MKQGALLWHVNNIFAYDVATPTFTFNTARSRIDRNEAQYPWSEVPTTLTASGSIHALASVMPGLATCGKRAWNRLKVWFEIWI